jgi:hypothetical protein
VGIANQAITPGRTTLLDAVNTLLSVIGEQPVNTLETQQIVEASWAERTLLEFHKEGQTRGWSWNSELAYEFAKDNNGLITVPANLISFAPDAYEWAGRFQLRGQKVYDREQRSYTIGSDVTTLKADVVWLLSWDESPEVFNRYVTIRSARVFSGRVLGDSNNFRYTAMDEQQSLTELQRVELEQVQANSLTGGPGLRPFPTYSPGLGLLGRNRGYMRG